MYRVGLEAILGFTKRGDILTIVPRVPPTWPEFTITYRFGRSTYEISVREPAAVGTLGAAITMDGRDLSNPEIPLIDDGAAHSVEVRPQLKGAVSRG
jgi:cyclic beta-1,2-glucan synthetase